ncbi:MAG: hypothetical protein ACRDL2_13580 [Gaiellaceae bacterium]
MKRLSFLVLLGVLAAACGGSSRLSKAQYQQRLTADSKAVQKVITQLTKSGSSPTLAGFATKVDAAEAVVKKAADDLAAAKPPKAVDADNATVVTALRKIQSSFEKMKTAAASGGSIAVLTATAALERSPELKAAERAIGDMKKQGYDVGVLGA